LPRLKPATTLIIGLGRGLAALRRVARAPRDATEPRAAQNRTTVDLAVVQVVQRGVRRRQSIFDRFQFDQSAIGERHQFDQLGPCPDEIADDVALRDDHVHSRNADVLAVADHVIAAHRSGHFQALCRRAFFADEIDDGLGALAVGQFKDRFDFVAIRLHEFPLRSPFR